MGFGALDILHFVFANEISKVFVAGMVIDKVSPPRQNVMVVRDLDGFSFVGWHGDSSSCSSTAVGIINVGRNGRSKCTS